MPDVNAGLHLVSEPVPDGTESFDAALAAQVGKTRQPVEEPQSHEPWRSTPREVAEAVLQDELNGASSTDLSAALEIGKPVKPDDSITLDDIGVHLDDGETATGSEVWETLGAVGQQLEQAESELQEYREQDSLESFWRDADAAYESDDSDSLIAAVAGLKEQHAAGRINAEDLAAAVESAVTRHTNLTDDEYLDHEESLRENRLLMQNLSIVDQESDRLLAERTYERASEQIEQIVPIVAKQQVDALQAESRAWAKSAGIETDAEAVARRSEAFDMLKQAGVYDVEAALASPGFDAAAAGVLLRGADEALQAQRNTSAVHAFHQSFFDGDTSIAAGITNPSPVDGRPVPILDRTVPPPKLDRNAARIERAMTRDRRDGAQVRQAIADDVANTDVAAALKAGRG